MVNKGKICKIHGPSCNGDCINPNVDSGMITKVWGPAGWLFLHCITFGYPYKIDHKNPEHVSKKNNFKDFFYNLGYVMPCKYCRQSYIEFMEESPIENHLQSRESLTKWFYNIHNKVNYKLGIPKCQIPLFKDVKKIYEEMRAKCTKTTDEERNVNKAKGCTNPANGTSRRSILKIIKCDRYDKSFNQNINDDFILIDKKKAYIFFVILIFLIFLVVYLFYNFN